MRLHPETGTGVVVMGNSTTYDADRLADALVTRAGERTRTSKGQGPTGT